MRYAIYGTGGFGREVAALARDCLRRDSQDAPPIVFVDDAEDRQERCNGLPVIGFEGLTANDTVVIAIADGRVREKVDRRCREAGFTVGGLRAPTVRDLDCDEIGEGSILCDFVTVTANARIGHSFHANIYSYVAHDCVIGDYVTFAPSVHCNGNVHIADYAYIGTGAMFVQGKPGAPHTVGEGAIVGMGAVVTKPVPAYTVVAGNPARVIRELR